MVSPVRWAVPAATVAMVLVAAVGLGSDGPPGVRYETAPPPEPPAPPVARDKPDLAPAEIHFSGFLTVSDPSREAMGPDPLLWSESCHRLDLEGGRYREAHLGLVDGASGGDLEDLDLYAYAESGRLASAAEPTSGIGPHHELALPTGTTEVVVCLAGGARASYDLLVS